jgi:hypothetical protein
MENKNTKKEVKCSLIGWVFGVVIHPTMFKSSLSVYQLEFRCIFFLMKNHLIPLMLDNFLKKKLSEQSILLISSELMWILSKKSPISNSKMDAS